MIIGVVDQMHILSRRWQLRSNAGLQRLLFIPAEWKYECIHQIGGDERCRVLQKLVKLAAELSK